MARHLGACLVAVLALAVVGCGGEEGYSDESEEAFMGECIKQAVASGQGALTDAQAQGYCQCSYDEVVATIPYDEFAEFNDKAVEDPNTPLPPKVAAVVQRCAARIGG